MALDDTDQDWEHLGKTDPYWGVLTYDKFHKDGLTEEAVSEFFASGDVYVAFILHTIRKHLDEKFAPASALDFGCGVGRLVIPLAKICRSVVGIDVSDSMLGEARARCQALGLTNVTLAKSDDELSRAVGPFDLINTYIVLQHIAPQRGMLIANQMLQRMSDGGVGVLHFLYHNEFLLHRSKLRIFAERCGVYPVVRAIRWLGERLPWRARGNIEMQMNPYDLNAVFLALQNAGVRRMHVEFTRHGCEGVLLFFKKQSKDEYRV